MLGSVRGVVSNGHLYRDKRVEFRGADPVRIREGNILPPEMAWRRGASRSRRPHACGDVLCTEPGRPHSRPARHAGPAHEGEGRTMSMHADEDSDEVVVPVKRSNKEGLPSAEIAEG